MEIVTGVFKSQDAAENAVSQLKSLGIPDTRIGTVGPGAAPERIETGVPVTDTEEPGMGKAMGAAVGGAMGAASGATLGLAAATLAIPGVGPVVAFGMIGAALLGLVGAAAGSAVGDTVEEELGEGIPHEDVFVYEDALRHGNSIVIASVDDDQAYRARGVLRDTGADDVDTLREHWWSEVREDERANYQGDWNQDEPSYRRGYLAALHPRRRGKAYSEVEDDLRTAYAGATLDRPFQAGYERGLSYRPGGENR
jgi:Na+-transporting methylmalonyl-CoA/oxaloacetate decarboxylase gamma subunit